MARQTRRAFPLLVAAQLAAILTGCGETPGSAQIATMAAPAPVQGAAQRAPKDAGAAPSVTARQVVTSNAAPVAAPQSTAQVSQTLVADAETPATPIHRSLFDHDFDKNDLLTADLSKEDPSTANAVSQKYGAQTVGIAPGDLGSWGLIGAGIGAAIFGVSALSYAVYTGTIGSHDLLYPTNKTDYVKDPSQWGIPYTREYFQSDDGLKLIAWYVPAEVPTTKGILVLHGHTSNKDTAFKKYGLTLHHDYNLYVYDSRFHGESEGKLTTLGYYERHDAVHALQLLRDHGNSSVGVMGESMGGAVAIEAAALDPQVKSCWADCAFDSLHDAIAPRAVKRKYPFPNFVAVSVIETACIRAKGNLPSADPINWVAKISPRPLYLVHGQADDDTTPMNGDKLFIKAGEPKTIWRTENTTHADSWETFPAEYKSRMLAFFAGSL